MIRENKKRNDKINPNKEKKMSNGHLVEWRQIGQMKKQMKEKIREIK